jgi:hypothetical protein
MRTDTRTDMTKLIVAFRNFADASTNIFRSGLNWIRVAQRMIQWQVLVNRVLDIPLAVQAGSFASGRATVSFPTMAPLLVAV